MLLTIIILTLDLGLFLFVGFKGASIFGYHFDGDQRKVGQGAALMLAGLTGASLCITVLAWLSTLS
mgnify:FL=1|jgi:hypothetical protein